MEIVVPAEKLAAAVNKYLLPATIRYLAQEQEKSEEVTISKKTEFTQTQEC
ncbi:hypothetical protein ABE042_22270 [Viridibacillus arvi]|uniref:hypothetical protein n=1 Tax=Viridibacillus arvi TaxID=263475 RepID=UPI003D2BC93F